jgi:hypothetical protein
VGVERTTSYRDFSRENECFRSLPGSKNQRGKPVDNFLKIPAKKLKLAEKGAKKPDPG